MSGEERVGNRCVCMGTPNLSKKLSIVKRRDYWTIDVLLKLFEIQLITV
jgi:hypothetical protein